jgi:hypothetical protein
LGQLQSGVYGRCDGLRPRRPSGSSSFRGCAELPLLDPVSRVNLQGYDTLPKIRRHLTYANIVSSLALVLVVGGGGAYAASHLAQNSVGRSSSRRTQ